MEFINNFKDLVVKTNVGHPNSIDKTFFKELCKFDASIEIRNESVSRTFSSVSRAYTTQRVLSRDLKIRLHVFT